MEMTQTYVNGELLQAQDLLWSGSIDQVDKAHNIISNLITSLQENSVRAEKSAYGDN